MYSDYDEDAIRPPDQVVRECLIHTNYQSNADDDLMNQIMKSSAEEYDLIDMSEQLCEYDKKERETHFADTKKVLTRLSHVDQKNYDIYTTVLSILMLYEEGAIQTQTMDADFCSRFFSILSGIRIPQEERERCERLIMCESEAEL